MSKTYYQNDGKADYSFAKTLIAMVKNLPPPKICRCGQPYGAHSLKGWKYRVFKTDEGIPPEVQWGTGFPKDTREYAERLKDAHERAPKMGATVREENGHIWFVFPLRKPLVI